MDNKTCLVITSVLLSFPISLTAQQRTPLHGLISASDSTKISGAKIINKTSKDSTISDNTGGFCIRAIIGDTLCISKQGYTSFKLSIANVKYLEAKLQRVVDLSEVTIRAKSVRQEQMEVIDQYRSKGIYYNGKPPLSAYLPLPGGTPLTVLHELFGGDTKREKRFIQNAEKERETIEINRRFNVPLVSKMTGLTGRKLNDFMDVYRPDYQKCKRWSDYEAITYIKKCYNSYQNGNTMSEYKSPFN
ncbi:hypothetical protein MTO98_33850 [Mucilaginibacter sp. SMC90]|uniref:hypothetical protein n=1 Tax=Mucilaginibacter sp. SMC90 TaxID=2929803 RepID=UPI001FB469AF|nr:hypothetical protein [Mucilaginibacter sp. SMC90]UOE49380.1 hypothetical protein MTO98_33850 [Mucilaginibacter sp. SMC90]